MRVNIGHRQGGSSWQHITLCTKICRADKKLCAKTAGCFKDLHNLNKDKVIAQRSLFMFCDTLFGPIFPTLVLHGCALPNVHLVDSATACRRGGRYRFRGGPLGRVLGVHAHPKLHRHISVGGGLGSSMQLLEPVNSRVLAIP